MLSTISCRGTHRGADTFGPNTLLCDTGPFNGGPLGTPILVHGFNCSESDVEKAYGAFARQLDRDATVFSWPGGTCFLDYDLAVHRSDFAGYLLRSVLVMRSLRGDASTVIAHSLGCRVSLTALAPGKLHIKRLILLAPAVDWDSLTGIYAEAVASCDEVHVLYSERDEVLKRFFPLGDFGGDHCALGYCGPKDPDTLPANVHVHDCKDFVGEHGDYLISAQCASLVRSLLLGL